MGKFFKLRAVIFLTIIAVAISLAAFPAIATAGSSWVELVYRNIKITMNGETVTPLDVSGNVVEPFIIDGTTYLPVRGVGSILGLGVSWDDGSSTVRLSNQSSAYYLVRASEMYDALVALYADMYWLLQDMDTLNDNMYYEEYADDFEEISGMHDGILANTGLISRSIAAVEDIITDIKAYNSSNSDDWLAGVTSDGESLVALANDIYVILDSMHDRNLECYVSYNAFEEFDAGYHEAQPLLFELEAGARNGQEVSNGILRNNVR